MLQTQEELKQGSQKINSMLQDMENKKVIFGSTVSHSVFNFLVKEEKLRMHNYNTTSRTCANCTTVPPL